MKNLLTFGIIAMASVALSACGSNGNSTVGNSTPAVLDSEAPAIQAADIPDDATYGIDIKRSGINWTGKKLSGSHSGRMGIDKGVITVSGGEVTEANIVVNVVQLSVTDIEDAEKNANLVGHLKSPDFFNTEAFPQATFELSAIKPSKEGSGYTAYGNVTIKGITNQTEFTLNYLGKDGELHLKGSATIDRTLFDIKYGSASFFDDLGDRAIYDEFEITFRIAASL